MPSSAHGITESQFYGLLAEMERDVNIEQYPAAWAKFVQWRHYGN